MLLSVPLEIGVYICLPLPPRPRGFFVEPDPLLQLILVGLHHFSRITCILLTTYHRPPTPPSIFLISTTKSPILKGKLIHHGSHSCLSFHLCYHCGLFPFCRTSDASTNLPGAVWTLTLTLALPSQHPPVTNHFSRWLFRPPPLTLMTLSLPLLLLLLLLLRLLPPLAATPLRRRVLTQQQSRTMCEYGV